MNVQDLISFCAIVDLDFNISEAAASLHISQPAVSRQIRMLEKNIGAQLFFRRKMRLTGLTEAGKVTLKIAERIKRDASELAKIGDEFAGKNQGTLTIATTHTYARYALPATLRKFAKLYPDVRLTIKQGNPNETAYWLASGEADISIAMEPRNKLEELVLLPFAEVPRVILVNKDHELLKKSLITLHDVAKFPIVTYNSTFPARAKIVQTFEKQRIKPNILLSATDADVIKTYVREGLGIAIVSALAYLPDEDRDLCCISAKHLFESFKIYIGLRKQSFPRRYILDFIEMFAPKLTRKDVIKALG